MKTAVRLWVILALLVSLRSNLKAGALDNWSNRNPGGGTTLNEVAYGSNTFVVVGDSGMILTSTDTTNWVAQTSGSPENIYGVIYGQGAFVAVGDSGALLTSPDGTNWLILDSVTDNTLNRVAYAGGTFVAVGDTGTILTSADGTNWTKQTTPTTNSLAGIDFANGMFVAVGGLGTILTSPNGTNWTSQNSRTNVYLTGVSYGHNTFVAVGEAGSILTSQNTSQWSPQTSGTTDDLLDITYANGSFAAVGGSIYFDSPYGPGSTAILTSSEGTNWASQTSPMPNVLNGLSFGGGAIVAAGQQDTLLISSNGTNWACRAFSDLAGTPYDTGPKQSAFGNGMFVVGGFFTPFFTSPDGVNWSAQWPSPLIDADAFVQNIVYTHGLFCASVYDEDASANMLLTSRDAITWTTTYSSANVPIGMIAYGNGRFVSAVFPYANGEYALNVLTSPDSTNWTVRTVGINISGNGYIAFGNGVFVIPANFGTGVTTANSGFLSSTNGINWQTNIVAYSASNWGEQNGFTFGNGLFLLAAGSGILTSADGVHWSTVSSISAGPFAGNVTFGNGEFILSTSTGVATSVDGISWVNHDLTGSLGQIIASEKATIGWSFLWLNSLVFGHGTFVGVNGTTLGGTIIQSAPLANPQVSDGQFLSNGTFQVTVTGQPGQNYAIGSSSNLIVWSGLTNLISTNQTSRVVDPATSNFESRFYFGVEQ